jgi:hypothetical protein
VRFLRLFEKKKQSSGTDDAHARTQPDPATALPYLHQAAACDAAVPAACVCVCIDFVGCVFFSVSISWF